MAKKDNFGGKKATPFVKGGGKAAVKKSAKKTSKKK
jgi:hypothetical protein